MEESKFVFHKNYKNSQDIIHMVDFLIKTKRVYDPPNREDGVRILIDRLWPRGMSKQKAKLDLWTKDVAPSDNLRQWFSHEPEKWGEFQERYLKELVAKQEILSQIRKLEKEEGTVTLIYSAKDTDHNNALVLKAALEKK